MKIALLFPLSLIVAIAACKRPTAAINQTGIWDEASAPSIDKTSLWDTIPARFIANVNIKEVNGVKASYTSGRSTSYHEYEVSSVEKLLVSISSLPFKNTNAINDTTCRAINTVFSLSGKDIVSEEEIKAADFFWRINPADYDYYECIKTPMRHTILINKKTRRVLHRIETMS
jgi:hypothetical protein